MKPVSFHTSSLAIPGVFSLLFRITMLISAMSFVLNERVYAQMTFERSYGGSLTESGAQVRQLNDSGYIAVGYTYSYGSGSNDIYLVRTDKFGDTLWTKTYGGSSGENGKSVNVTSDGGFIIAGQTSSYGPGTPTYSNAYLVKTDSAGNLSWSQAFGSPIGNDDLYYSMETSDHEFISIGMTPVGGYPCGTIIKADSAGNILWLDSVLIGDSNQMYHCIETADHHYLVTGSKFQNATNSWDLVLIKYDTSGAIMLTKYYDRPSFHDHGIFIEPLTNGGYAIAGESGTGFSAVPWFLRVDAALDTLWTQVLPFSFYIPGQGSRFWNLSQTNDGNYIIVGRSANDVRLIKTDTSCNILWSRYYGSASGADYGFFVRPTNDNGFIVCGLAYVNMNLYLIKTDSLGFTLTTSDNSLPAPSEFKNLVFPNPFAGNAVIKFPEVIHSGTLRFYDVFGKMVMETNNINGNETYITSDNLHSGVYVFEVMVNNKKIFTGRAITY